MDGSGDVVVDRAMGAGAYLVRGQPWRLPPRYELLRVLGQGSFSVVCLARDKEAASRSGGGGGGIDNSGGADLVAIKLQPDVLRHKANAKNVLRELFILRRMRHPNVVALRDVFTQPSPQKGAAGGRWRMGPDGRLVAETAALDLYLVTEYCDGGDLYCLGAQLTDRDVRSIMHQLLRACRFVHARGVVHRDVKSANVLIAREGARADGASEGRLVAKLADFGQARSFGGLAPAAKGAQARDPGASPAAGAVAAFPPALSPPDGGPLHPPMTGGVATPCYRAPEVIMASAGARSGASDKADVWSLGWCVRSHQRTPPACARAPSCASHASLASKRHPV